MILKPPHMHLLCASVGCPTKAVVCHLHLVAKHSQGFRDTTHVGHTGSRNGAILGTFQGDDPRGIDLELLKLCPDDSGANEVC